MEDMIKSEIRARLMQYKNKDMDLDLGLERIQEIMWLDDCAFEKAVKDLDTKGILCLMEALQTTMRDEQQHFDKLTLQLRECPDRNSYNYSKISAALCTSQRIMANMCTKHLICSGQQSLRESLIDNSSDEDPPLVTIEAMAYSKPRNGVERKTKAFQETLRFFQSQANGESTIRPSFSTPVPKNKHLSSNGVSDANTERALGAPTIDKIISNVKSLRESNGSGLTYSSVRNRIYSNGKSGANGLSSPASKGVTRSDQICDKVTVSDDTSQRSSLLSNFNPVFEENQTTATELNVKMLQNRQSYLTSAQLKVGFENPETAKKTSPPTVPPKRERQRVAAKNLEENNRAATKTPDREALILEDEPSGKTQPGKHGTAKTETPEVIASLEPDYDSKDFVVHKANFSEADLKALSEETSGSVNGDADSEPSEDQIVDHFLPCPDYTDVQDYYAVRGNPPRYEDHVFAGNSCRYVGETNHYYYEDKELEVIPEEDEDDFSEAEKDSSIKDEAMRKAGPEAPTNGNINHNNVEWDSGLTDDQRSSSATEECELEDDTDSAKGSLPLQDSSEESNIDQPNINMFQNVEYHKHRGSPSPLKSLDKCERDSYKYRGSSPPRKILDIFEDDSNKHRGSSPSLNILDNSEKGNHKNRGSSPPRKILDNCEKDKLRNGVAIKVSKAVQNGGFEDDTRPVRKFTSSWDPKELIKELYRLDIPVEAQKQRNVKYINKEGYMEKLPSGRKKATYWDPWKKKYIKLKDGFLYCYDNCRATEPSLVLQLMGGRIDSIEGQMIGVDDQKGHYIVLRCVSYDDTLSWEIALRSHCAEDFCNAYINPSPYPLRTSKSVIVIDIGSCSIRAGILMDAPTLPQLFFPTICAGTKYKRHVFGVEALKPNTRQEYDLSFPLYPAENLTKYSLDVSVLPDLLKYIFKELNVHPENYKIQLSIPRHLTIQTKTKIARILLEDFRVNGMNLTHQAILSLHAYNSNSGIVVDIGERLDIIPIIEGYIVQSGTAHFPFGGERMLHHVKQALAEKNVNIINDIEAYLARYVMEQLCYVAQDYKAEMNRFHMNPDDFEMSVSTSHFFTDESPWKEIVLDGARFNVPEGLFSPGKWGLDVPSLQKLVHNAIQECSVDMRREMCRSIYISGGLTLLPGFAERLETEIKTLIPNTIMPKVHASPYRYHMSYLGACQIALDEKFDSICVTKQIFKKEGNNCVKRWCI